MKALNNLALATVAFSLLAIPAAADGKKGQRNNNGSGEPHGKARAEEVQTANKKGDKDHSPSQGSKSKGQHEGWDKKAQHKAKGHS